MNTNFKIIIVSNITHLTQPDSKESERLQLLDAEHKIFFGADLSLTLKCDLKHKFGKSTINCLNMKHHHCIVYAIF